MKAHGPITGIAIGALKLLREQSTLDAALDVGKLCFPNMSTEVIQRLYERRCSVWFTNNDNTINVGWTT